MTAVVAVAGLAAAAAGQPPEPAAADGQDERRYRERISVTLDQRVVRVVDRRGYPVLGLGVDDFEVRAGGQPVKVAAVDWVSAGGGGAVAGVAGSSDVRRLVLWIQADLNAVRIKGHLRMLPVVRELLEDLPSSVEVALLSFDSRLKLWSEFTTDHRSLTGMIDSAVRFGSRPLAGTGRGGPLAARLAALDASEQFTTEDAMLATARALGGFAGEKELVILGWGIGRTGPGSPGVGPAYRRAERALIAASVSVFVLDVTYAGAHSLEAGLRRLADRTGGTYDKTHSFARQAARRLLRTLEGHYLLSLERGDRPPPRGGYRVRLRHGIDGRLLADAG